MRRQTILALSLLLSAALYDSTAHADEAEDAAEEIERGRYMVMIGACNDCHTPSYPEKAGKVPESEWLVGTPIGFQGPWGTSYAANLRLIADRYTAEQFMARARSELLPPMPWFNLVAMTDADLLAMYRYIRSLGPAGETMPAYVSPGVQPLTPFYVFVPQSVDGEPFANQF